MELQEYDDFVSKIDDLNKQIEICENNITSMNRIISDLKSDDFGYILAVIRGKVGEDNKLKFEDTVGIFEDVDEFKDERLKEIAKNIHRYTEEYLNLVVTNLKTLLLNMTSERDEKINSLNFK